MKSTPFLPWNLQFDCNLFNFIELFELTSNFKTTNKHTTKAEMNVKTHKRNFKNAKKKTKHKQTTHTNPSVNI